MKGIELPANTMIIIAIAVLVLIVAASFFTLQTSSGISNIDLEKNIARACNTFRASYECDLGSVNSVSVVDGDRTFYLANMCRQRGAFYEGDCARLCNCAPSGQGSEMSDVADRSDTGVVTVDVFPQ